jgi:acetyl/propionyl-CoA carboxylase alpha subunit/acetyl-CoA carboxylase carboxyltransferase component
MSLQATARRNLSRIVVANRGEAAVRFMRAARTWSSQHNEPLETIALYTHADEGARFVRMASRAICIGEAFVPDADGRPRSAYLDIDRIVGLAREAGADGLWPGWGFASEKPELPDACEAANITFLGPPASAMRALGDKIAAKRLAESCEVPVSAWSGGPVDAAGAQAWAERIGYPVLLKATAGGGGRGIRRVFTREEIDGAYRSAAAEAAAAFGDPSIFVEALISEARHIEVQVLADRHGGVWAVGTRDCSMQRRQQKVLEEAPAPGLAPEVEQALCEAAVRLARACGYISAGTAEFLLLPDGRTFYFLEMNTRLQVEHTVTEEVYGLDLVGLQIDIARGLPLPAAAPPAPRGVAIEARLNAEDPDQGFAPRAGRLLRFKPPQGPGIRIDSGYSANSAVPTAFDSMLAKVIAHGATRERALALMEAGLLDSIVVLDSGLTNRALLLELVGRSAFRDGPVTTVWLDRYLTERPSLARRPHLAMALAAAAIMDYLRTRYGQVANFIAETQRGLPRNIPDQAPVTLPYELDGRPVLVEVATIGPQEKLLRSGDWQALMRVEQADDWTLYLEMDGRRHAAICCATPVEVQVELDGVAHRFRRISDGRMRAMLPAAVAQVHVQPGDQVAVGDRLVTLEAMKMETTITSSLAGTVRSVLVRPAALVAAGDVMVEIDVSEPAAPGRAVSSVLPPRQEPPPDPLRLIEARLLGFDVTAEQVEQALAALETDSSVSRSRLMALLRAAVVQEQLFKSGQYDDAMNDARESSLEQLTWFVHHRRLDEQRLSARMIRRLGRFLDLHGIKDTNDPRVGYALMRLFQARAAEGSPSRLLLDLLHALARSRDGQDAAGPVEQRVIFEKLANEALQRGDRRVATAAWNLIHRWHDLPAQQARTAADLAQAGTMWQRLPEQPPEPGDGGPIGALCAMPLAILIRTLPFQAASGDERIAVVMARIYGDVPFIDSAPLFGRIPCRTARLAGGTLVAGLLVSDPDDLAPVLAALPRQTEADLLLGFTPSPQILSQAALHPRARWTALWAEDGAMRGATWQPMGQPKGQPEGQPDGRPEGGAMAEQVLLRDLHPAGPIARELARYQAFVLCREPAPAGVVLLRATAGRDERLLAFAEVEAFDPVVDGHFVRVPVFEAAFLEAAQAMRDVLRAAGGRVPAMNRIALFIRPPVHLTEGQLQALAQRLAPASLDLGLETASLIGRFTFGGDGAAREQVVEWRDVMALGPRLEIGPRGDRPVPTRSTYEQKVLAARRYGLFHPYEVVSWLIAPRIEGIERGRFEELDLDSPAGGRLAPVRDRAWGENPAGVVLGLITNWSARFPDGFTRVLIIGDATMEMGSLGEAECRRIVAAIDLAEERGLPIEWVALSGGARIALDSGTENLDWTAAVLRRIVTFTAAGGVVNVIVDGPCVGAQSYWNAEATMLMHCRGALVMTPRGYMVLTGKRALEVSGSVAAATNEGIGGLDIMLANGEAQYAAADLHAAYEVLMRHYDYTYVPPGEKRARAVPSNDPPGRDIAAHPYNGPGGFATIGELFSDVTNPGRKKPFAIREVIRAISDQDAPLLERWADMAGGETTVAMHGQMNGQPVSFIGIESQPIPRRRPGPPDGPAVWMSGTLFPNSSRKAARAIRAASGICPVVLVANLSGFDGSPESIRERQLEYGAEIGKAVVEFDGPILFCVIARYHGGAYVVFSRRLSGSLEALALEGSYASVIGGGAAAAVVFTRLVAERVSADPRVRDAREALGRAAPDQHRAAQEAYESVLADVEAEIQSAFAREFDSVHSVSRALQVGSLHAVLPVSELRAAVCGRLQDIIGAPNPRPVTAALAAGGRVRDIGTHTGTGA